MNMSPECPICKNNLNVQKIPDCSTHAGGYDRDKTRIISCYSDTFKCTQCNAIIHYYEEQLNDRTMLVEIKYKRENYIPSRKVIN